MQWVRGFFWCCGWMGLTGTYRGRAASGVVLGIRARWSNRSFGGPRRAQGGAARDSMGLGAAESFRGPGAQWCQEHPQGPMLAAHHLLSWVHLIPPAIHCLSRLIIFGWPPYITLHCSFSSLSLVWFILFSKQINQSIDFFYIWFYHKCLDCSLEMEYSL